MPAQHRHPDICTGHGSWPPRENASASPNVFANGKPKHRVGDAWQPHGSVSPSPPHGGTLAAGSPNVFTNGRATGHIGDPVDCGSLAATGSPNVFVNGG